MDPRQLKRTLRREVVARILALEPADRRRQQAILDDRFGRLPGLDGAATVLLYVTAFPEEIETSGMIRAALGAGRRVACPRVDRAANLLVLHEIRDPARDLVPGTRGIPEPRLESPVVPPGEVDWALVPGIAFDALGYRLGRGAGHYDRLLPRLRPETPRWALAFDPQWVEALPVEPHDRRLDGVSSPGRELAFDRDED